MNQNLPTPIGKEKTRQPKSTGAYEPNTASGSAGVTFARKQAAMQASKRAGYAQAMYDVMGTLNRYRKI